MSAQQAGERPAALEAFMSELRALRQRAGNPSFRQMAAKSGAVSHATLHLTVTGYRLQPWETVREFVRACDGDEQLWQLRWAQVHATLAGDPATAEASEEEQAVAEPVPWWRSSRALVPLAVGLVVVAAVLVGYIVFYGDDPAPRERAAPAAESGEPVYPGDSSKFIADVTIPDGTKVKPGKQFIKVWQIQNTGQVEWRNRFLRRTDAHDDPRDCRTPPRIPINDTAPGQHVQITVSVKAPNNRANCKVYWKMVDGSDRKLLPGNRPIYFEVRVQ